jgi:hypothetical protein
MLKSNLTNVKNPVWNFDDEEYLSNSGASGNKKILFNTLYRSFTLKLYYEVKDAVEIQFHFQSILVKIKLQKLLS